MEARTKKTHKKKHIDTGMVARKKTNLHTII